MAVTATEARKNLFRLIQQVNEDRAPVEITSRNGDAVLMSRADYEALEETAHLLRVPANARLADAGHSRQALLMLQTTATFICACESCSSTTSPFWRAV